MKVKICCAGIESGGWEQDLECKRGLLRLKTWRKGKMWIGGQSGSAAEKGVGGL